MTIETKFNRGDIVVTIDNDDIKKMKVSAISYYNGAINYTLLKSRACTSLDKDKFIEKRETECFATIDDMADYYKINMADAKAIN